MPSQTYRKYGGLTLNYGFGPGAILAADEERIRLYWWWNYDLPKTCILRLSRHQEIFSAGLRIEHNIKSYSEFMVFRPSLWPGNSAFQKLKVSLESLGYEVHDRPLALGKSTGSPDAGLRDRARPPPNGAMHRPTSQAP